MSTAADRAIDRMLTEGKTASEILALHEKMKSMTYGRLPSQAEFNKAYDENLEGGKYRFGNDARMGNAKLDASQLWKELKKATTEWEDGDDEAGEWASSVLITLGFEWV